MPRIYISPSSQEHNSGIVPYGIEETEMNQIADILIPLLNKDGRFVVDRNTPDMDVNQMAAASNKFGADLHLPIHGNAGGGVGTEVYAYGPGTNSERFATCLYNQIAPLSPGKDRGVKFNKGLCEVGDAVNATSALIELGFHDNAQDAAWMHNSHQQIAEGLYKGVCDFYGYGYVALVVATPAVVVAAPTETIETSPKRTFAVDDGYLWVLIREPLMDEAIKQINTMGYAAGRLNLAK